MKASNILLAALCLALAGCSPNATEPPQENLGPVYLTVDKSIYSPEDTVLVTLHNDSEEPVFLDGCSALYLATKTDTGWVEQPTKICVWEGIIQKVGPHSIYQEKYEAKYFRGAAHRFVAGFGLGCQEGMPTSQAKCTGGDKVYSPTFTVLGYENAASNLTISVFCTWQGQILAALLNNSERTYFARLGDGSNDSLEQEDLYVAEGTDGYVERFNANGTWSAVPREPLIEGTRFVMLRPFITHRLILPQFEPHEGETGTFRIKIEYFVQIDPPAGTLPRVDYSPAFQFPCQ